MKSLLILIILVIPLSAMGADSMTALKVVFAHEGGLQCDPADPGNWTKGKVGLGKQGCTKYGIATNTYPNLDIRHLTLDQARLIYEKDFWNPLHLSEFEGQVIATETFDTAVNCGKGTAANMHLRLINAFGPAHYVLKGALNSEQVEWINQYTRKKINRRTYYKALNVLQGERYLMIIEHNPKMMKYSNSWYSRVGE